MTRYWPDTGDRATELTFLESQAQVSRHHVVLWVRITVVLAMAGIGFYPLIATTVRDAIAGSQTTYLLTVPVLAGLIASGHERPTRGVTDAESDWIVALLVAAVGFIATEFTTHRLPTLAAFWHSGNIALVAWVAASTVVMFAVRQVFRMWRVWLFATVAAMVPLFLLATAHLGGSDTAVVRVAAALGTTAVFLASRFAPWRSRFTVTVLNLGVALAADWLLVDAHLLTRVALVTGLVPVLTVLALHQVTRVTRSHRYLPGGSRFPHRQPWSYLVLLVISGLLLWHSLPVRPSPAIARAEPGWTATLGLQPVAQYPFIMRMLGNSASLNRYAPEPDVAVDVITAPELARIQDFAHFVWYPADSPANYRPATIDGPIGVVARSIHSNADTAATPNPTHWFALTWVWQIGDAYQQVTVVANQSGPDQAPPAPEPVTWRGIVLKPAQWLARQRPLGDGVVEERVIAAATRIATRILAAAAPR